MHTAFDAAAATRELADLPARRPAIAKTSYTHDAVIDFVIANPSVSQGAIAAHFGYTQAWMSIIMSSDAFRARYAERSAEIIDPQLKATVQDRFQAVLTLSLEKLADALSQPTPPPNVVLKAVELGARGLDIGGFGRIAPPTAPPPPADDRLERLAHRLIDLQDNVRKGHVYENASEEK